MAQCARLSRFLWIACLSAPWASAQAQGASEEEFSLDGEEESALPAAEGDGEPAAPLSEEQTLEEERKRTDPYEDPKETYFFAGAAWRYLRMPSWALEWGLESAPALGSAGSFYGEFAYRRDGFQVTSALGYQKFHMKGPFQLSGDIEQDTEWLDGKFNLLVLTATLTWSTSFTDWFALEYGVEAGLLAVFGDLTRSEAYRKANGDWAACPSWVGSATLPSAETPTQSAYCAPPLTADGSAPSPDLTTNAADEDGEHYGVKAPRGLSNKGIPNVLPVLGPRLSLRFKPIAQLALRVDVPLPVFPLGFVGALSAQYGF